MTPEDVKRLHTKKKSEPIKLGSLKPGSYFERVENDECIPYVHSGQVATYAEKDFITCYEIDEAGIKLMNPGLLEADDEVIKLSLSDIATYFDSLT
ncbi:MAG: hypothetical protein SVX43_19455 [Cyanobacteriota bacterium]|nr:hypothetical protein [Cyanobacteriota bacterium]